MGRARAFRSEPNMGNSLSFSANSPNLILSVRARMFVCVRGSPPQRSHHPLGYLPLPMCVPVPCRRPEVACTHTNANLQAHARAHTHTTVHRGLNSSSAPKPGKWNSRTPPTFRRARKRGRRDGDTARSRRAWDEGITYYRTVKMGAATSLGQGRCQCQAPSDPQHEPAAPNRRDRAIIATTFGLQLQRMVGANPSIHLEKQRWRPWPPGSEPSIAPSVARKPRLLAARPGHGACVDVPAARGAQYTTGETMFLRPHTKAHTHTNVHA